MRISDGVQTCALPILPPWMFHLVAVHEADIEGISYETDRSRFIGRGRDARTPRALVEPGALAGSQGSVLDPIAAIRSRLTLAPDPTATIDMGRGIGAARDECARVSDQYRDRPHGRRTVARSATPHTAPTR